MKNWNSYRRWPRWSKRKWRI